MITKRPKASVSIRDSSESAANGASVRHKARSAVAYAVASLVAGLALVTPGLAVAQCVFNIGSATKLSVSLVRAYAGCPSFQVPGPTSQTGQGVPSCVPVVPERPGGCSLTGDPCDYSSDCPLNVCSYYENACVNNGDCVLYPLEACVSGNTCVPADNPTVYQYGPKGSCSISGRSKIESDCSTVTNSVGEPLGLPAGPCHVTYLRSKCKGIVKDDGVTPIGSDDEGWSLRTLTRATTNDPTNGDMTVVDFPVTFFYSPPSNGSMSFSTSTAEALSLIVGPSAGALSPCTQLDVVDASLADPASRRFARVGLSTHP